MAFHSVEHLLRAALDRPLWEAVLLDDLRDRATAAEILGKLAYLAGFNPSAEPKTAAELLPDFDWDKVPGADIRIPEGLF